MTRRILIFPSIEKLDRFAAQKFVEIAAKAVENRGKFTVALAGGSTPKSLYRRLSGDKYRKKIEWRNTVFFFGDERNAAPDSDESNFRMVKENLFDPLEIKPENIFRWRTELGNPNETAADYEKAIREYFYLEKNEFPVFDLFLLGMGDDGHTASLFPFTPALTETKKIAAENYVEKLDSTRLTLTFPVINCARNAAFLVTGANKAETLKQVLEGVFESSKFPSQNVKPEDGNLFWLVDESAAEFLKKAND